MKILMLAFLTLLHLAPSAQADFICKGDSVQVDVGFGKGHGESDLTVVTFSDGSSDSFASVYQVTGSHGGCNGEREWSSNLAQDESSGTFEIYQSLGQPRTRCAGNDSIGAKLFFNHVETQLSCEGTIARAF